MSHEARSKIPDPSFTKDWREWARALMLARAPTIPEILVGTVTLGAGTATTVTRRGIRAVSSVSLTPTNALGAGLAIWVAIAEGSFTVNHPVAVGATFAYICAD